MSEKIDITIDSSTDVEAGNEIVSTSSDNNIDIEILEPDYNVTINKREYVITGDNLYIPKTYDESPQWLKDIIGTITDFSLNQKLTEIGALSNTLYALIDELEVAKNTYTNSIITSAEIDEIINSRIETLNSSIAESDATIVDLITTKATPTEASSLALNVLTASINDGAISSLVSNLQNAISTTNSTLSNNIDIVHAEMTGDFEATSDAVSGLQTYIGVDNDGIANGTGLLSDVEVLQKQNDGVIETITGTYDVMIGIEDPNNNTDNDQLDIAKEPYVTWKSLDVISGNTENRSAHVGDVYIKYTNATEGYKTYDKAYKFIKVVPDSTSPYSTDSEGFTWAVITDTDVQNAYVAALNALDLADNKRRVFVTTPTVPYDIGDLWIKAVSGGNQLYKSVANRTTTYNSTDWSVADDAQVNNFISEIYEPDMLDLQKQIDGQVNYYFYESSLSQTPTSISGSAGWNTDLLKKEHHGDIAYDKSTSTGYYYDRITSVWILINSATNSGVIESLKAASVAQATADGKVSHMYGVYQSTSPATTGAYKYWLTTTKVLKVLEGASWVDFAISKLDTGDIVTVWDSVLKDEFKYYWNGNTWYSQVNGGLVAGSKAFTDLDTSLGALGTTVSGHTGQLSTVDARISNGVATVESKWQYNSNLIINGVSYNSGFGLSNSAGTGVGSEFWIDASKLKFTNSAKTGSAAPFTIDASGSQPQITFNGKVTFGSGQVGTIDQAIAAVVETVAVGDKNINITDNLIPTTSLVADTDNSGYQFIGTPTKSMSAGLESFSEAQIILDGSDEVYSPYVDEVTIPYYYRFGIKGITNLDRFKVITINASNVVTYNNVTVTMEVGKTLSTGNWYTVDGIINPLGGTTAADGDIRDINGVKVGSINNFVMPSGTTKVLLGWVANCTISRIKMCKITADTITSDFSSVNGQLVDLQSQIDNVDVSWNSLSGKDILAQKFGYATYSALESAATAGQTVVVGGKINTELIEVNAINANQINTVGLIAENISANEIVGKTIIGAVIQGAVIKASYLDLDGELEVLTNYHITVAMYNANPSLYTDAVYLSGNDEYRIPSISTVREVTKTKTFTTTGSENGSLYSYNTANVGTNNKAVKISPIFTNTSTFPMITAHTHYDKTGGVINSVLGSKFRISLGSIILFECIMAWSSVAGEYDGNLYNAKATYSGAFFTTYSHIASANTAGTPIVTYSKSFNIGIGTLTVNFSATGEAGSFYGDIDVLCSFSSGTIQFPMDWTNGCLKFEQLTTPRGNGAKTTFALNSSLYINNMI